VEAATFDHEQHVRVAFEMLGRYGFLEAPDCNFDEFIAENPDLLSRAVLDRWYSPKRLQSDLARRQFLLPGEVA
jgi:hypothetical protein